MRCGQSKLLYNSTDDGCFPSQLVSDKPLTIPGMLQDTFEDSDELLAVKENISKLQTALSKLACCLLEELRERNISVNDVVDYITFTPLSFNREI